MACLCAPTSHEGSFRCRLHRLPNPIINPSSNHPLKAVNQSISSSNSTCNQLGGFPYHVTVRESSADSTAPIYPLADENGRFFSHFPQAAADRQYGTCCIRYSRPPDTFAGSSVSSSLPKSLLYRQPPSMPSTTSLSSLCTYSSSPSPSSPFPCTHRPLLVKTPSLSSSSSPKCANRASSPPVHPTSWCGTPATSNNFTPSPSHAAAMAIMKRHLSHSKRVHNRNILGPTSASKIGPSRLSRMAVACADELPILKEEKSISGSYQRTTTSAPDTSVSNAFVETSNYMPSGLAPSVGTAQYFKAAQIGLEMRLAVNKFKQSESSCRVVGSNKGSYIMPTVY